MVGMQGATLVALSQVTEIHGEHTWSLVSDVIGLLSLLGCLVMARSRPVPIDPAALGFVVGALLSTASVGTVLALHDVRPPQLVTTLVLVLVGALAVAACVAVFRVEMQGWSRGRLAAVVVSVSVGHVVLHLAPGSPWGEAVAVLGHTASGVVLVTTALGLLRRTIEEDRATLDHLHGELTRAVAGLRDGRAVMHEVNATIAGISSANRLIRSSLGVSAHRRRLLEEMVDQELARLSRLVDRRGHGAPGRPGTIDLDDTIATLALAQEARGQQVTWEPSGATARADGDSVTEILNILLDNAARHGGDCVAVEVRQCGSNLEIDVSDDGPGIPPEVRSSLFEWGSRGPGSSGQGIGLTVAHDLALREGGYLRLIEAPGRGATFVVGLQAAWERHEQRADLA